MNRMNRLVTSLCIFCTMAVLGNNVAKAEETKIEVNVYKIFTSPIWHSGIVIDGIEYFFDGDNHIETCAPGNTGRSRHRHHRKMTFTAPHSLAETKQILEEVIRRWDGTRYDVAAHNCNRFVDDVLQSLGAGRLDREYIKCSGIAQFVGGFPGGATFQEIVLKLPSGNAKLEKALKDDWNRLRDLPSDTKAEAKRLASRSRDELRRARKKLF